MYTSSYTHAHVYYKCIFALRLAHLYVHLHLPVGGSVHTRVWHELSIHMREDEQIVVNANTYMCIQVTHGSCFLH